MNIFKRRHKINNYNALKFMAAFIVMGIFLFSTAYALSNQLFTISGTATIINYGNCPANVSFKYEEVNSWGNSNSGYTYQVRLSVKNDSSEPINDWTIILKGPTDLSVNHANAEVTIDNGQLTFTPTGSYTWAANISSGETKVIELQLNTAEPVLELEYLYFNSCMVVTGSGGNPLVDFSVEPTQVELKTNQTSTINIYKMPADAYANFTFLSSDPSVATIDANGIITGISIGSANITISSNGITRSVAVTVTDEQITLTSLSLGPKENRMKVGDEKTLITTKVPADAGTPITYTSSDPSVATVDSTGKVTAINGGTAVITASAEGLSDTANITVYRDALSEDLDMVFSYQYYDTNNIQFAIDMTNIGHSEIHKITFKIDFPVGTTWAYWNNWPAMFAADSAGTTITSTSTSLSLQSGSYINFTGNITLPSGYYSTDYLSPTIYDVEVE